ncbi:hypothetical protein [Asticcacaulis sp. 201]|uniref:hypothetical protein n=1 Tax=Asticcacaulis sp. 201 TaxID=3028787 RepID=UPI002916DEE0|nr:hypothetical protein [Asticcacaulis sp. 201]MDV6331009.1 hypothetical protein [Asticcacaulis sp. 201]
MAIQSTEFDYFLKILLRLAEQMIPQYDILADIEKWKTECTPLQQRRGLEAGLGDLAENGFHLPPEDRQRIDDIMRSEGLMTLSELQVLYGQRIRRLLKKKRLIREEDAVALKGALDADLLDAQEFEIAKHLIASHGS